MSQFNPIGGVSIFQISLKFKKVSNIRYFVNAIIDWLILILPSASADASVDKSAANYSEMSAI